MSLGTSYDDGTWLAHAEASYMDTKGQELFNPDTASAYLSIGRRFSNVTLYSLYGISHSFQKKTKVPDPRFPDPRLIQLHQEVEGRFNSQAIKQQSLSIGLRWDFHPKANGVRNNSSVTSRHQRRRKVKVCKAEKPEFRHQKPAKNQWILSS